MEVRRTRKTCRILRTFENMLQLVLVRLDQHRRHKQSYFGNHRQRFLRCRSREKASKKSPNLTKFFKKNIECTKHSTKNSDFKNNFWKTKYNNISIVCKMTNGYLQFLKWIQYCGLYCPRSVDQSTFAREKRGMDSMTVACVYLHKRRNRENDSVKM